MKEILLYTFEILIITSLIIVPSTLIYDFIQNKSYKEPNENNEKFHRAVSSLYQGMSLDDAISILGYDYSCSKLLNKNEEYEWRFDSKGRCLNGTKRFNKNYITRKITLKVSNNTVVEFKILNF